MTVRERNKTSCAPNSTFFKAAFMQPNIIKWLPDKILEARKKGVTVDAILHEWFEIMRAAAQLFPWNLSVNVISQGFKPG